jgi:hypothetical protein
MTRLWPEGEAIETWGGEEMPSRFAWRGTCHHILEICNLWRVHTRWWDADDAAVQSELTNIWREYVKVTTDSGFLCLLYRDLINGGWFIARVYD